MLSPIVFLHIPKTAGSSFYFVLKLIEKLKNNNVNVQSTGKNGILSNFTFKDSIIKKNSQIYSGHHVFGDECKKLDTFTLVRDVHKTFFSNVYYQYFDTFLKRNLNKRNIHAIQKNINLDFELKEADESIIIKLINNNLITSNPFTKTFAGIPYEMFFYVENDYKISQSDYETAISNLKYFKLIGNTNSFEIFVKKFISLYGFIIHENLYGSDLHSYTHQRVFNYDRNFIDLMIKKLYQEIVDYNFYDMLLMREIEKINKNV